MKHPAAVTACNMELENLITDSNRSIATLAITTLLKVHCPSFTTRMMLVKGNIFVINKHWMTFIQKFYLLEKRTVRINSPKKRLLVLLILFSFSNFTLLPLFKSSAIFLWITRSVLKHSASYFYISQNFYCFQTGNESSVDRLMKQISSFMNEISDEFKIVVVQAIQ